MKPTHLQHENIQLKEKLQKWQEYNAYNAGLVKAGTKELVAAVTKIEELEGAVNDLRRQLLLANNELAIARGYADKLARGLPEGMPPKDIEIMRSANAALAQENFDLREKMAAMNIALERDVKLAIAYYEENKQLRAQCRDLANMT